MYANKAALPSQFAICEPATANPVLAVPEQIQGTCFFPGGTGLWHGQAETIPEFPVGGVMVLGHDFHSVLGYERSRLGGSENLRSPTWRQFVEFLARVPIALEHCFFTNAYMGLRAGAGTTGKFPGAASAQFVQACREFLLAQIAVQQPALILALGNYVPAFLAPLSPQLADWSRGNFRDRDRRDIAIRSGACFTGSPLPACVVVSLLHPSFRPSNVRHRRWKELSSDDAEVALVREAWRLAGVAKTRRA